MYIHVYVTYVCMYIYIYIHKNCMYRLRYRTDRRRSFVATARSVQHGVGALRIQADRHVYIYIYIYIHIYV